jgi:acetyltransferase-like isoleucine patch superfamily enzyme
VTDGEKLCQLAIETGCVLMVGHLLHYHNAFIRLKALIQEGELGKLQYVYSNRLNFGRIRHEENILWSFAPHDLSMILALVGEDPSEVSATGSNYLRRDVADVTVTHLSFPRGVDAHIYVSWLHPIKEQKLVVAGDRGMALFDDSASWDRKLIIYRHRVDWQNGRAITLKGQGEPQPLEPNEPLLEELQAFKLAIEGKRPPVTDGWEGLRVLRVLDAAERSISISTKQERNTRKRFANVTIHETAHIDDGVEIGDGTKIWHFSHIMSRVLIGQNVVVGQNVSIGPDVRVGNNCKIQNNVSVYKGVLLEDDVFCGPSCVFTNVLTPRATVERKDEFLPTRVGRGATIGANATIICGNTIGTYAMIGAGAVVTDDVPPFALMVGVPARRIGWVSRSGERLDQDLVCRRTGERYRELAENVLESIVESEHVAK